MPDCITYESWNCDLTSALPKRSYLYHLRPIGVGTAHVESLTGYIARIAEAHCVPTGVLLTRELFPRLEDHSAKLRAAARKYAFIYDAYVLNGIAECPRNWVRLLQTLTGQSSLHVLTMLTWSRVISDIHLLRNNRAWCPYCFDSWRNANLPIYETANLGDRLCLDLFYPSAPLGDVLSPLQTRIASPDCQSAPRALLPLP